jgi:hypothetical protein
LLLGIKCGIPPAVTTAKEERRRWIGDACFRAALLAAARSRNHSAEDPPELGLRVGLRGATIGGGELRRESLGVERRRRNGGLR